MTLPPLTPPSRSLQILKTVQYILAGLVLALGLITGFSLITGASNMVENVLIPLQLLGGGTVSNLIAPVLTGFLINLGIVILIIALILSILFYTLGRLIGHSARLEARLARLEARPWNAIE